MMNRSMTNNVHELIKLHIQQQSKENLLAVDATLGNGQDLAFLIAQSQVQEVWGFDIQQEAIDKSKMRLKECNKSVHLIKDCHSKIAEYVEQGIDLAMFNLGYLPGGDKEIVTQYQTSLQAIKTAIERLNEGGIISVMTYPGHMEGKEEHEVIVEALKQIRGKDIAVLHLSVVNVVGNCPNLIIITKN